MYTQGVPVVMHPVLSYADLAVRHGYPLVASTERQAALLMRRLAASPELRQRASELGLAIAEGLGAKAVAGQVAGHVCDLLRGMR